MKKSARGLFFGFLLSAFSSAMMAQDSIPSNVSAFVDTLNLNLSIEELQYPFINYSRNFIEWNQCDAISHFFDKLNNAETQKVRVLHIGDSHVQADYYTGIVRNKLQSVFGYGGRGFVFPYKSAGTHATYDYVTESTGKWEFSRNIQRNPTFEMGISGAAIHTCDTAASFEIRFRESAHSIQPEFRKLRILCKTDSLSFGVILQINGDTIKQRIPIFSLPQMGYVDVVLPMAPESILLTLYRNDSTQTSFECYGLIIESMNDNGILYSSVGINGAGYKSVLKQHLFKQQLREYQPDLVVIDLGANDFYPNSYNEIELTQNLHQIISNIREVAPTTSILITNSHDLWKRRMNISWTANFAKFTRKMAQKEGCAFYDYYHVSGKKSALLQWRKLGLAQPDKVHLTYKGYQLKAALVFSALLTSYREYQDKAPEQLIAGTYFASDSTELDEQLSDSIIEKIPASKPVSIVSQTRTHTQPIFHVVVRGESLAQIAGKYQITNEEIMRWNNLKTKKLFAGQKLRLVPPVVGSKEKEIPKTQSKNQKSPLFYTVKKGETLFMIAKKQATTVTKLKQLNRLKTDKIKPGMKLKIRE